MSPVVRRALRGALAWASGIALVAAAWCVLAVTPGREAITAPFFVHTAVGERAEARDFAVTVTGVHRAAHVESDGWSADGNWLVVDVDAVALRSEYSASLLGAELHLGDRVFSATERTPSMYREALHVGIPRSGSIAFELPADLDGGSGEVQLALATDPRLNSVVTVPVDLGALPSEPRAEVRSAEWTTP